MFCCNDYRNGIFEEKVSAIDVAGGLRLGCRYADWSPRMRVKNGKVFIARKGFPYLYYKEWHGNWCWDLTHLYGADVLMLLNWLKQKDWFDVEEGETRMFNVWKNKSASFLDSDLPIFEKCAIGSL